MGASVRDQTVVSALVRVLEAGQKVLVDRIDLTRLEVRREMARAAVLAVAGMTGFVAWVALMAALVVWVGAASSVPLALLLVAGLNGALAAGGLAFARRRPAAAVASEPEERSSAEARAMEGAGLQQPLALPR